MPLQEACVPSLGLTAWACTTCASRLPRMRYGYKRSVPSDMRAFKRSGTQDEDPASRSTPGLVGNWKGYSYCIPGGDTVPQKSAAPAEGIAEASQGQPVCFFTQDHGECR